MDGANEAVREGLGARREAGSHASCRRVARRPCFGRVAAGVVAAALISPLAASGVTDLEPGSVDIQIASPRPGEVVKNRVHMAPVRGAARSGTGDPVDFDVLIVLDVSHSTRYPSGSIGSSN